MQLKKINSIAWLLCLVFIIASRQSTAQAIEQKAEERKIPSVTIKKLDGANFLTDSMSNNGKPIIISFWATWCKPCFMEYDAIAEVYSDWQKETGVKLIAVSIDDSRTSGHVRPMVNLKNYPFEFYLDINQDFKRALNVINCPHTFLVDNNRNIVWQSTGYTPGSEEELYELIKKLSKGEKISSNK